MGGSDTHCACTLWACLVLCAHTLPWDHQELNPRALKSGANFRFRYFEGAHADLRPCCVTSHGQRGTFFSFTFKHYLTSAMCSNSETFLVIVQGEGL